MVLPGVQPLPGTLFTIYMAAGMEWPLVSGVRPGSLVESPRDDFLLTFEVRVQVGAPWVPCSVTWFPTPRLL